MFDLIILSEEPDGVVIVVAVFEVVVFVVVAGVLDVADDDVVVYPFFEYEFESLLAGTCYKVCEPFLIAIT